MPKRNKRWLEFRCSQQFARPSFQFSSSFKILRFHLSHFFFFPLLTFSIFRQPRVSPHTPPQSTVYSKSCLHINLSNVERLRGQKQAGERKTSLLECELYASFAISVLLPMNKTVLQHQAFMPPREWAREWHKHETGTAPTFCPSLPINLPMRFGWSLFPLSGIKSSVLSFSSPSVLL